MALFIKTSTSVQIVLFLFAMNCSISLASAAAMNSIVSYGADPTGRTDSTESLLSAWSNACSSSEEQTTIYIPSGTFLVGRVMFSGPCKSSKINIQIAGTISAPADYNRIGKNTDWIKFDHVDGVSIYGGVIDGRGAGLWECKTSGERKSCPNGAQSLTFSNSNNIVLSGLSSINSELYHIVFNGCREVTVQGVKVTAPRDSPNTDGIHVQMSTDVTITSTTIKTGDDCISIGPGTSNLWIEQVACGPGHGISIGSLGKEEQEAGVVNVTVKSTVFTGTENGLRIKTWGRPSYGFVKGVVFEHAIMNDVHNPIIIDQNYCPDGKGCTGQNSGVKISDVTYNDIHGTSATQVAVSFDCSDSNPCSGIGLQDIKLTYGDNRPAEAFCKHANGDASGLVVPPSCL